MEGYLKLNGVLMPSPKVEGVTFTPNKVWSKNTGRPVSGDMVGDIVTVKESIGIEFPPLSPAEVKRVEAVVSNKSLPFFSFEFCDGYEVIKRTVYADSPSRKLYSAVSGMNYYTGYKVELVEK